MAAPKYFLLLFLVVAVSSISSASATIHLHFYFNQYLNGDNQSSYIVAKLNNTSGFGTIRVGDNALTEVAALNATIVGRVQGFAAIASQDGTTFMTTESFIFTAGTYNGSSIDVVGRLNVVDAITERPIVGGTGQFRFASGYVLSKILSVTPSVVSLENDLYVLP